MTIRDLHPEWINEFAASALEVLVDQAMGECPLGNDVGSREFSRRYRLSVAIVRAIETEALLDERIEWAAKISTDVLDYASFEERELGE